MESKYVSDIRERQQVYDNICKSNWPKLLQQINRLLEIGTEAALQVLMEMQNKPEFRVYYLFYNELYVLKLASEIYMQEKERIINNHIFQGVNSLNILQKRMNQNKFQLLRLNFDIDLDVYWKQQAETGIISKVALNRMIEAYCFDKMKVKNRLYRILDKGAETC